jgi:preprotein translocase subunit SecD
MIKHRAISGFLLALVVLIGLFVYRSEKADPVVSPRLAKYAFKLGLDLNGGTELTYRADISKVKSGDISGAMSSLRDVIERRVNLFGVSEPVVQVENPGIVSGGVEHRLLEHAEEFG